MAFFFFSLLIGVGTAPLLSSAPAAVLVAKWLAGIGVGTAPLLSSAPAYAAGELSSKTSAH